MKKIKYTRLRFGRNLEYYMDVSFTKLENTDHFTKEKLMDLGRLEFFRRYKLPILKNVKIEDTNMKDVVDFKQKRNEILIKWKDFNYNWFSISTGLSGNKLIFDNLDDLKLYYELNKED